MIPVTPVVIPEPFAENGAKNTIPDQSPGGTEPNASWNTGFPPITMLNRKAGGKPPLGADFNGILNALSQHAFFTQSGCIFPWRGSEDDFPGLNYLVGAHVLGADMKEYIAVQPSGPDIPASGGGYVGPRDPTTDSDRTWWRPAMTEGDLPEFDGTTIKLINGKYGVPEFTAPTAGTPGKAGLVPAPGATDPSQQALRVLTMNGFGTLTAGSLDVSWERADSTNIVLGAELVPAGSSVNAFTVAGDYYADTWTDAPLNEQGILSIREMRTHGNATDDTRIQYATFLALTSNKLFWRGGGSKRPAGQPWTWAIDWREVLGGGTDKAPMPHAPDGMVGSWQLVIARATDPYLRIPAGGSWAVYSGAIWVDGAMDTDGYASVFAGGTVIGPLILYSSARQSALCYMVQNSSTKHSITNDEWQARDIVRRVDGSYVIRVHELPYHVPNEDAYANLWIEVDTYAQAHPEQVTDEPAPPVPTEEELLARAKTLKTSEFDRAMADIDAKLARSTSDIVAAMLTPATLAADDDAASALSADDLEQSKAVFTMLRAIQAQNRALRKQVQTAETVEEVQAVEPVTVDRAALGGATL